MVKLTLFFSRPDDVAAFEATWSRAFVPQAEAMPGIRRVGVSRVVERLTGDADIYLGHELFFDDLDSARRAMAGEFGQAAGRALMGFAAARVTVTFLEHQEEDRAGERDGRA